MERSSNREGRFFLHSQPEAKAKLSEVAPWSLTLRIMIASESSKAHTNRNQLDYRESLLHLGILSRSAIENVNT